MKWKTWIWWMDVCKDPKQKEGMKDLDVECKDLEGMEYKDLEWTLKMNDGKLQVWKEECAWYMECLDLDQEGYHEMDQEG